MNAKYAFDEERSFYKQSNNPTEEMLRKIHLQMSLDVRRILNGECEPAVVDAACRKILSYLETCGPTAAIMCMAAHGRFEDDPASGALTQREEELTDFFNDSRHYAEFRKIRDDVDPARIPGNRVPQYYPYAVKTLYNVRCEFIWTGMQEVREHLKAGRTVQLCFKNPGHFIAAVALEEATDVVVYNDPWPEQYADGKGFNRKMAASTMAPLVEPYALVYYPFV